MLYSITFFGIELPTYAICMYLGVALAALVAVILAKKRETVTTFDVVVSAIYTMIGAMTGAKLLYLAVSWENVVSYIDAMGYGFWDSFFYVVNSGFVFYGGFIGGFLGLMLYLWQFKRRKSDFFTIYAVVLPLGHAIGRVGCYLGGCCYGMESDSILAVDFPIYPSLADSPVVSRLPVQLFEAVALLLLFVLLLVVYYRFTKHKTLALGVYLIVYPIIRFLLEFLRGDALRGRFLLFSTSQWISLGILAVTGVLLYLMQQKNKTKE